MNSFEFYRMFLACQRHFDEGSGYDFFKYNGKMRCSERSFDVTKGKYLYEKYASKLSNYDKALTFCAGNFYYRDISFISDCSMEPYYTLDAYKDSLFYKFEQDIITYKGSNIRSLCMQGSKEPYIYISVLDFLSKGKFLKKLHQDNIVWENIESKILKYKPFFVQVFNLENPQISEILKKTIKSNL